MGTWNGFYVRREQPDVAIEAAIRGRFPQAIVEHSPKFSGARMPDEAYEPPERELAALSSQLATDVIWLGFQSTVDAFLFGHWRAGAPVRTLVHGCREEAVWERAEGAPQDWERSVFFPPENLNRALKYAESPAQREELKRRWQAARIEAGTVEPGIDARDCAHQIARHFELPHYG